MTPAEYNECVDEYADALFRYCIGLVHSAMDADDLVQMCFLRLWEHRKNIEKKAAKNWLYKTAYRAMIDQYRKGKRESAYRENLEETGFDFYKNVEYQDLILQSLKALSPVQKNLILLRDYEGYSYKELCELTGLSMTNVKVTLYRSRKILRRELEKLDFSEFTKE